MAHRIEWLNRPGTTGKSWNPVTGCTKISAGCKNCYAERMSKRLHGRFGYPDDEPFRVTLHPDRLDVPLHWRKPRTVFVCSMGDLFHEDVPFEFTEEIFGVISQTPQHTYLILTKRPDRMADIVSEFEYSLSMVFEKLFSNVWLGATVEDQEQADKRIPVLLKIPAAVRFVSVEPMLGPVQFGAEMDYSDPENVGPEPWLTGIDWLICGAETGPGARPMQADWARDLRNQCTAAGTPFFFKKDSDGNRELDGRLWEQWPGAR